MTTAVLIFTFSPVQPFIIESRRPADLFASSQILVELAKAAAEQIGEERLVFPSQISDDIPNRLVARVPWDECPEIVKKAEEKLLERWQTIARQARGSFLKRIEPPDNDWEQIWERQLADDYFWEIYWAAANEEGRSYIDAYQEADRVINAAKRVRRFAPADEPGIKDTLSGRRQALHTHSLAADRYWSQVANKWVAAKLRPNGRERLDAIGVVKRFSPQADLHVQDFYGFPSTSSVASMTFLEAAKVKAPEALSQFKLALDRLHPGFTNVNNGSAWPYDGDLLYADTLRVKRLWEDYGAFDIEKLRKARQECEDKKRPEALEEIEKACQESEKLEKDYEVFIERLDKASETLAKLYKAVGEKPSPYYAVIVMDGDNMGKTVNECTSPEAHARFSRSLSQFAARVPDVARAHNGFVVFNGGDDVLALAPLASAFPLAFQLAELFHETTHGTASAGMAVTHHQSPLSSALRTARTAESYAKHIDAEKAAVAIIAIKRGGEAVKIRSKWREAGDHFIELVDLLEETGDQKAALASGFVFDVVQAVYALPDADEKLESELKRLLKRHANATNPKKPDAIEWAKRLRSWAASLPGGADELSQWLIFARFAAQGGGE